MSDKNKYARPTSMVGKARDSLREDGIKKTLQRGLRLIQRRDPTGFVGPLVRPIHNLRTGFLVNSRLGLHYPVTRLIENQYVEGQLTRCDALIAAEALQGDQQTQSLYTEVADQIDQLPKLEELETGFDDKGRSDPVSITYSGRVADVASCARKLTNDYPTVEAKVTGKKPPSPITRETLRNVLSDETYAEVDSLINSRLRDSGYLFQIVIWPSALQFEDQITEIVESRGEVRDRIEIDLGDNLRSFMREIYETQESVVWDGIWDKYDIVSQYGSTVRVLFIELPEPHVREGTSHQMRYIKETARTQLHTELDHGEISYVCILHSTDNFKHNIDTWRVIEKYASSS